MGVYDGEVRNKAAGKKFKKDAKLERVASTDYYRFPRCFRDICVQ